MKLYLKNNRNAADMSEKVNRKDVVLGVAERTQETLDAEVNVVAHIRKTRESFIPLVYPSN